MKMTWNQKNYGIKRRTPASGPDVGMYSDRLTYLGHSRFFTPVGGSCNPPLIIDDGLWTSTELRQGAVVVFESNDRSVSWQPWVCWMGIASARYSFGYTTIIDHPEC